MINVTCRLNAKKLGSALCAALVIEYFTTLLYFIYVGSWMNSRTAILMVTVRIVFCCFLSTYAVSILICLRLNLSTVHDLCLPLYRQQYRRLPWLQVQNWYIFLNGMSGTVSDWLMNATEVSQHFIIHIRLAIHMASHVNSKIAKQ